LHGTSQTKSERKRSFRSFVAKIRDLFALQLDVMELLNSRYYPDEGNSLHLTGVASTFDS